MQELEAGQAHPSPTVAAVMRELAAQLARAGIEEAGGDVRRLAAAALGVSSADILKAPERVLTTAQVQLLRGYAERRRRREPVSRILGERDFYGRTFAISPATLDPRPDSETVLAATLEVVREEGWLSQPLRILDVGTGSGCLLLTLLCELPQATGLGTDISTAALAWRPAMPVAWAWRREFHGSRQTALKTSPGLSMCWLAILLMCAPRISPRFSRKSAISIRCSAGWRT